MSSLSQYLSADFRWNGVPAKRVLYHGREWMLLVETGWTTWQVDDGQALMLAKAWLG